MRGVCLCVCQRGAFCPLVKVLESVAIFFQLFISFQDRPQSRTHISIPLGTLLVHRRLSSAYRNAQFCDEMDHHPLRLVISCVLLGHTWNQKYIVHFYSPQLLPTTIEMCRFHGLFLDTTPVWRTFCISIAPENFLISSETIPLTISPWI